jgi:hypothetical protein
MIQVVASYVWKTAGLMLWGATLWMTLGLASVRGPWDGLLCGPWGCTAPLTAILACHLAWFVLLTPIAVIAWRKSPPEKLWQVSLCLLFGAGCGLLAVAICGAVVWLRVRRGSTEYLARFVGVEVVSYVELPLSEVFVIASVILVALELRAERSTARVFDPTLPPQENICTRDADGDSAGRPG